ncbi:MAG: type II secretion system protein GspK [Pseudomonadota bacterium]|nr:type II secretion system protein GspK [Pseudomonadota bacterium]
MRMPKTYLGFPVEQQPTPHTTVKNKRRAGVAIIIAVMIISLMMVFTADMIVNSQVNLELVSATNDNITAEYLAKSGFNLALLLLSIDYGIDLTRQHHMKQKPTDSFADIWAAVNHIPIGEATAKTLQDLFALNPLTDAAAIEMLGRFDGEFTLNISDEATKINVNYCAAGEITPACKQVQAKLLALFNCPLEKSYLDSKNIRPLEIVTRFQDWIDRNDRADPNSGFSGESDPYLSMSPPYKAKNSQFDSIDELKLIDGWDDDLHAVFSPYLTTYPFKKTGNDPKDRSRININTAPRELLACLVPEAREKCGDTFDIAITRAHKDKSPVGNDARSALKDTLCLPENDKGKLDWFTESSPVYRIEVKGTAGFQTKSLQAVIVRGLDTARKTAAAYRLLYWRMG